MTAVMASPEMIRSAATDLASVGSNLDAAHLISAPATIAVAPAAADEVSTAIAGVFSQSAQEFHAVAGRAATFHEHFVQGLTASAASYVSAEAANIGSLQPLDAITGLVDHAIRGLTGEAAGLFDALQNQALSFVNAVQAVQFDIFGFTLAVVFIAFIVLLVAALQINLMLKTQFPFLFG